MTTLELELTDKPSPAIREIETPDGSALLDIRQGLCLGMTPVGVIIWRRLKLNESPEQIVSFLVDKFRDVPRQQIRNDVLRFIEDLKRNGLLIPEQELVQGQCVPKILTLLYAGRGTPRSPHDTTARTSRFLFWKALFGLLLYDVLGCGKSFVRVYRYVLGWPLAPQVVGDSVYRVCEAVNYACLWYPKRVLCLQRSAVTTCLLRNCGVPAQMTLGAQKVPFRAHAWTEVDGAAINEREDVQTMYLVWDRC